MSDQLLGCFPLQTTPHPCFRTRMALFSSSSYSSSPSFSSSSSSCSTSHPPPLLLLFFFFLFFFFFSFCVPQLDLWGSPFWFCLCDRFFDPTVEVITFHLRGLCVLGVFLLPAFNGVGHECQDLLSPCDACVHRLDLVLYSHLKEFWRWGGGGRLSPNPCYLQEKSPLYCKNSSWRRVEPMTLHQAGQRAQHTTS